MPPSKCTPSASSSDLRTAASAGRSPARSDPAERVAGVGREEPGDILWLAQCHVLRQNAAQVFGERQPDPARRSARRGRGLPEGLRVLGQAKGFELGRATAGVVADQQEIAIVGDENQTVAIEVLADLPRFRRQPGVVADRFDFDDTPLRHRTGSRLASLALVRRIETEVGMAGALVGELREA